MSFVAAAATVAAGAYSANRQAAAAKDAARAGQRGAGQMNTLFRASEAQQLDRLNPYRQVGMNALNQIGAVQQGDYSGFTESPGYQFAFDEGMRAVDNSGAARGMSLSGAQLKALNRYGQGVGAQQYDNYLNNLYRDVQVGQNAVANSNQVSQYATAGRTGAVEMNAGAQQSGIIGQANARSAGLNNAANTLAYGYGQWQQGRQGG